MVDEAKNHILGKNGIGVYMHAREATQQIEPVILFSILSTLHNSYILVLFCLYPPTPIVNANYSLKPREVSFSLHPS